MKILDSISFVKSKILFFSENKFFFPIEKFLNNKINRIALSIIVGISAYYLLTSYFLGSKKIIRKKNSNLINLNLPGDHYIKADHESAMKIGEVAEGLKFFIDKKYQAASEKFEEALKIEPDNGFILFHYGTALLMDRGENKKTKDIFNKMKQRFKIKSIKNEKINDLTMNIKKSNVNQMLDQIKDLYIEKNYQQAFQKYEEALLLDPKNSVILAGYAEVLCELGKYDEAIQAYEDALTFDKGNVLVMGGMASALLMQKKYDQAKGRYLEALAIDSKNSFVLCGYGATLHQLGDYQEAISYFKEAHEAEPENPYILKVYGNTLAKLRQYNKASEITVLRLSLLESNRKLKDLDYLEKMRKDHLKFNRFKKFEVLLSPN